MSQDSCNCCKRRRCMWIRFWYTYWYNYLPFELWLWGSELLFCFYLFLVAPIYDSYVCKLQSYWLLVILVYFSGRTAKAPSHFHNRLYKVCVWLWLYVCILRIFLSVDHFVLALTVPNTFCNDVIHRIWGSPYTQPYSIELISLTYLMHNVVYI